MACLQKNMYYAPTTPTGAGNITCHRLREYEVKKLRYLPAAGWRTHFFT